MTSSDVIAISAAGLSALSLVVSIWAAYKAAKLTDYQVRLSNRVELHMMLLEIDREILHDPSLSVMFKSLSTTSASATSPFDLAKQDMYVSMCLNLFELPFAQFKEIRGLTTAEKEVSEAWIDSSKASLRIARALRLPGRNIVKPTILHFESTLMA